MKMVYKWNIAVSSITRVMVPIGAKVVWVEDGWIWIEGDFESIDRRECIFHTRGTGEPIGDHLRHVGTYRDRIHVWHIYVYAGDWLVTS